MPSDCSSQVWRTTETSCTIGCNFMDISKLKCFQIEKPRRKTAKQQVREAQAEQLETILAALRDKKRSIPKEWVNGFNSAISLIEGMKK